MRRPPRTAIAVIAVTTALLAACAGGGSKPSTATTRAPAVVAVALGDSYSSGEGAPPYDPSPKGCNRADAGWARRLRRDVAAIGSLDLRACSGATVEDVLSRTGKGGSGAQLPSTPDPSVTLVTITVGGNDIGFGAIVATCFILSCAGVPGSGSFHITLDQLATALDATLYPAITRAYPKARIVHVGYPRLTPPVGQAVHDCAWLSPDEQPAAAQIVAELDQTIHAAATRAHVTYVDTTEAFAGHELCSGSSWVNPVSLQGRSQAHPTAAGQQALERSVAAALQPPPQDLGTRPPAGF